MTAFLKKLTLGVALLLGLFTSAAVATPIYNYTISGTFLDPRHAGQPGGTFSGTFSVTGTLNASNVFTNFSVQAASFDVTSFTDSNGFTYSNLTYSFPGSTLAGAGPFNYMQFDMGGGADSLRIYFTNTGLSTTGATLALANSYEYQAAAGNRAFLSGSVTAAAVPEPSSLALLGAGLAMLAVGFAFRRMRKPASASV